MAKNELRREDLAVLAVAFGFDNVAEFEGFMIAEQYKANDRQRGIINGSEYV